MKLSIDDLLAYLRVQDIAKRTISTLKPFIVEGASLREIRTKAEAFMKNQGVDSFWYHGVGALVYSGRETTSSISGREYFTSDATILKKDVLTIDLSPEIDGYWGDFARTFVVENGSFVGNDAKDLNGLSGEIGEGMVVEEKLHSKLKEVASEEGTFGGIYDALNEFIDELGFENLDFADNLGHTIEKRMEDRSYLQNGNQTQLGECGLFTFEPHIKKRGGNYGFKREDMYYFRDGYLGLL